MLHTLKLKDFRQHADTVLEFVPGVNTIVGLNNSGKSTLPEAIEFALYGSRALRDNAKGFIRDGQSDGSAVVKLNLAADSYVVGRNSKNAEVRKNGELDARYKDNVTAYIAHITGVNQTGFRLGHYVRQKELAAFSSLRPGKRHETVERMLKVNAVDKAIKRLKEEVSEIEIIQKSLLATYQDVDAINNELDDLQIAKGSLELRQKTIRQDLDKIQQILGEQRKTQRELMKKPELARLRDELTDCALAARELKGIEAKLEELGEVSHEAYQKLRDRANELREQERQSIAMRERKKEIDSLNPVKPEEVSAPDTTRLEGAKADVARYIFQLEAAEKKVEEFKKLAGAPECDRCHQKLSDGVYQDILTDLERDVELLDGDLTECRQSKDVWQEEYDNLMPAYRKYQEDLEQYSRDCQRQEYLLKDYIEVYFDAEEQAKLDDELIKMQDAREAWAKLDQQRKNLQSKVDKRTGIEARIEELVYLDKIEDDPELDKIVEENEETERQLNSQMNDVSSELAHTEGRTAELNRLVTQMTETRESINANYTRIAGLKAMQEHFVLFKRHLTAKIRPLLQQVAETLFHKTTKNRYASYNLSSDYEITLSTHAGYVRKLATISGSENDLACLCLRLAIATLRSTKLAGSLGFIILDEISGSFDDDRTKQTLEGLLELRDVIPQIINITHKPVEMKYADRIFTVKESNGIASVTHS